MKTRHLTRFSPLLISGNRLPRARSCLKASLGRRPAAAAAADGGVQRLAVVSQPVGRRSQEAGLTRGGTQLSLSSTLCFLIFLFFFFLFRSGTQLSLSSFSSLSSSSSSSAPTNSHFLLSFIFSLFPLFFFLFLSGTQSLFPLSFSYSSSFPLHLLLFLFLNPPFPHLAAGVRGR